MVVNSAALLQVPSSNPWPYRPKGEVLISRAISRKRAGSPRHLDAHAVCVTIWGSPTRLICVQPWHLHAPSLLDGMERRRPWPDSQRRQSIDA
ncbi:hypothetical protein M8818_001498 [Zalaria obscura]|uniref:Uncharacterized protein n=1 Tax=Zalaria obscura TaxID=2024903 RepID=A0ACC3SLY2_9PEZI